MLPAVGPWQREVMHVASTSTGCTVSANSRSRSVSGSGSSPPPASSAIHSWRARYPGSSGLQKLPPPRWPTPPLATARGLRRRLENAGSSVVLILRFAAS